MKGMLIIIMVLFTSLVHAAMYKCEENGKTIYQQIPCMTGEQKVIRKDRQPTVNTSASTLSGTEYREGIMLGAFNIKTAPAEAKDYIAISYKVDVKNMNDHDKEVQLKYNALAADGFLVNQVFVRGTIPAQSHKALVGRLSFSKVDYNKVARWELDSSN